MDRSVGTGELRQAKKSEQREVARVREMISNKQQHIPVTELIGHINRHLRGMEGLLRFPQEVRCCRISTNFSVSDDNTPPFRFASTKVSLSQMTIR